MPGGPIESGGWSLSHGSVGVIVTESAKAVGDRVAVGLTRQHSELRRRLTECPPYPLSLTEFPPYSEDPTELPPYLCGAPRRWMPVGAARAVGVLLLLSSGGLVPRTARHHRPPLNQPARESKDALKRMTSQETFVQGIKLKNSMPIRLIT